LQRNSTNGREGFYDFPNTSAFANYSEWAGYLREHQVHLAFIDHSFPHFINSSGAVGLQTSAQEVQFRWDGLSHWLGQGLSFWWYDQNWGFSIPPPTVSSCHGGAETSSSFWRHSALQPDHLPRQARDKHRQGF